MAIRINVSKTFKTQVVFNLHDEKGKVDPQSFEAEFKRLTREQIEEMISSGKKDGELLAEVLVGWGMKDADDKSDIPFNEQTLAAFLTIPGAGGVTMLRFLETCGASKAKN